MKRICMLIAALAFAAGSFVAEAQNQQLPNDPAVRTGKLENGLTYYIRHNEKPAQRAEFYLATNVGAIQETPDQDGLAHFLEHMCFNGTKNFPDKGILNWLQSIGASFGGNVNAATGIDQTTYMLNNIPLVRETVIDSCLLILHDYSHFVTNDPVEIDKERPVIIEERRTRRNAQWRTFEKSLPYLYGDSKYATCTLIGSQENLESFKPESLENFYHTWYRPDMQAVIVVGDIDVDAVEAKIKGTWADIPAAENPKAKDVIEFVPFAEPRVATITDPETSSASIQMVWEEAAHDEALNSTAAGFSMDLFKGIFSLVMRERFNDITSKADAPFLSGSVGHGSLCEAFEGLQAVVSLKEDNILGGYAAFLAELEKAKRFGFTEGEVSRAKDIILASFEKAANQADTRMNSELVRPLINHFFDNEAYMEPATENEIAKAFLGQISAAIMNQIVPQMFQDENLVVIYSGPEKAGIQTPSKEQILGIIAAVGEAQIEAPEEEAANVALMDADALKGGKVKKTASGIYGSTVWTLSNGVRVFVLPTEYKKDQILFNLSQQGGESLISDDDYASFDANIYGMFTRNQGLSQFKGTELSKVLAGKNVNVQPFISSIRNGITGNSSVKDLETAFQLLYLEYVDPRFDEEEWDATIAQLNSILPNLENRPDIKFSKKLNETLYGGNIRKEFISGEKLAKASLPAIEKNYRKLFSSAKGADMIIVGDVDLETLKPLVEKYVGSLPSGKKAKWKKGVEPEIVKGESVTSFATDMETPLTTVIQVYSHYRPYSASEDVMTDAVSYILDQIYTDTLREEEGGTYGASSKASARKNPTSRSLLQVAFTCKPSMADNLARIAREGFEKLAADGPTDEQFTRTVENFKKNIPESRINNSYWLSNISNYLNLGIDLDKERENAINGMSKESIQKAASYLLESGNFFQLIQTPGKTSEKE
ncbi:MAG: insulinase family protein [Bacteroidales bacterium]|nr:insulinase family protein [Candidatus Cryptobacteroides faecihippi]